jgi:hypothetical protein
MGEALDTAESTSVKDVEGKEHEAEALKLGWVPKEKFRGNPERWVDAKAYVDRGNEVLPIVKAQLRKTEAELEEFKKTSAEWRTFSEAHTERQVNEWKAKYEEAVRDKSAALTQGDGEKFVEAEARQKQLEAEKPQPPKTEATKGPDPEFKAWLDENPWYVSDRKKRLKADLIGADLVQDGLRGRALYDAVKERLEELEQDSTGTTRSGPQRGGRTAASTKGARTYENLKPDYKDACDRFVKTMGVKQADYVAKCDEDAFRS